eukprot:scaffold2331_cov63-Phaeocystis_antarctica.AAC.1
MVYRSGGENAGTVKCDVLSRRERRACVFVSRDVSRLAYVVLGDSRSGFSAPLAASGQVGSMVDSPLARLGGLVWRGIGIRSLIQIRLDLPDLACFQIPNKGRKFPIGLLHQENLNTTLPSSIGLCGCRCYQDASPEQRAEPF